MSYVLISHYLLLSLHPKSDTHNIRVFFSWISGTVVVKTTVFVYDMQLTTPMLPARAVRTAISTLRNFPKSNFAIVFLV